MDDTSAPRAASYHALLRALLRQPDLTSDACLMVADALDEMHAADEAPHEAARGVADALRSLAPIYAHAPLPAEPAPPAAPWAPATPFPTVPQIRTFLQALHDLPRSQLGALRGLILHGTALPRDHVAARLTLALLQLAEDAHP